MMLDEREYGEPIPGIIHEPCGGSLVTTEHGPYCDWCAEVVPLTQTHDEEAEDYE